MADTIIIIMLVFISINTFFTPSTTSRVEKLLKEIKSAIHNCNNEYKLKSIIELQNKIISNQEEMIKILKDKLEK